MRQGDVFWVALDPTVGSEIQKTRPCVIVSPDVMINGLRTVIVAPMTSKGRITSFRPHAQLKGTDGLILLDQISTVDKRRLLRPMGRLDEKALAQALTMLQWIFSPTRAVTK
jgi:mRNA interferase MazF